MAPRRSPLHPAKLPPGLLERARVPDEDDDESPFIDAWEIKRQGRVREPLLSQRAPRAVVSASESL